MGCLLIDYASISEENERKYGTDIGRIGGMLLANRYSDRSHFIYELLQNAEDALKRRPPDWPLRTVRFELTEAELVISHFGEPFSEHDVRGVCGIDESTKDITAIGRFGIGFKSVNAYTDRPEVHSGAEHFAIERYVHPVQVDPIECEAEETRIVLPFQKNDEKAFQEIAEALNRLGARTLLFLRQIKEIRWSAGDAGEGLYLRDPRRELDHGAERISIAGEDKGSPGGASEDWIVFSQPVNDEDGVEVGHAELAFLVECDSVTDSPARILPATNTQLVVYFPTIVATDVGFLIQGPYRTTPSRDNIVSDDSWNRSLVDTTAELLVVALKGLRELGLLYPGALQTFPIDQEAFGDRHMFGPLYEATLSALRQHRLLPTHDRDFAVAGCAKLARGKGLRELLDPQQLSTLFADGEAAKWLDKGITPDQTPGLQNYLMRELDVKEITPEDVVRKLNVRFLEAQTNFWIAKLYAFLAGQPTLLSRGRLDRVDLVRLEDGSHVPVRDEDGSPCAFLPGKAETDFPIVCDEVCQEDEAREFLERLGLSEPDIVDDVIAYVLPRYASGSGLPGDRYASDIQRILKAFETDSSEKRERLKTALSQTPFVAASDAASGQPTFARPGEVYIATDKLYGLFKGVEGVLFVSDNPALRTEPSRNMLVAAGAKRYLAQEACERNFTDEEFLEMRKPSGDERITKSYGVEDYTLRGLGGLLNLLPKLGIDDAKQKSNLLWEALRDYEKTSPDSAFQGIYRWFYYSDKDYFFDASFLESLRTSDWIVDKEGSLCSPAEITFDELGWVENHALAERLGFKPRDLDRLAKNAGLEPQLLSLLKRYHLETAAQLQDILDRVGEPVPDSSGQKDGDGHSGTEGNSANEVKKVGATGQGISTGGSVTGTKQRKPVTYLQVNPTESPTEEGGKVHVENMELEERGIQLILEEEPHLQRTRVNNPGFDLVEKDAADRELRWVEVKVIRGPFSEESWVGLSRKQFETAEHRGEDYWLYVVEHAETSGSANIIRIPNPSGQAKTFVFDHGWRAFEAEAP